MRPKSTWICLTWICAAIFGSTEAANADLVSLWEFEDSGNLLAASVGSDLALTGTAAAAAGSGGADAGAAQLSTGDYFTATNPIGANGGGSNTNAYTLVMDMNAPGSSWNALVDIDGGAFSGDGEVFTNPSGGLGIDGDYYGTGADGSWHRIALVFDMASDTSMTTYIDGALNHAHTDSELGGSPNADIDGRWSLLGTFNPFSDNGGGEEETLAVSNLALFSSALSAEEVSALGGPGSLIPEPNSIGLLMLGSLAFLGLRKRSK